MGCFQLRPGASRAPRKEPDASPAKSAVRITQIHTIRKVYKCMVNISVNSCGLPDDGKDILVLKDNNSTEMQLIYAFLRVDLWSY